MSQSNLTTTNPRILAVGALVLATTAWGGLFHAGKQALSSLDPFWFTVLRYAGATSLLVVLLLLKGGFRWHELRPHCLKLFSFGMLGYGMFGTMVFIGLSKSQPSHGAVIMATMPLTTLFIRWASDGLRPQWWAFVGALLAIIGVSLVSGLWTADSAQGVEVMTGDLIALVGTLGWIFYTRGAQKLPQLSVIEYTTYTAVASFPGLLVVAMFATSTGFAHIPTIANVMSVLPSLLYIVVIATVLAALAFNLGVSRLGASNGILFINFVPVSALFIGIARGEQPTGMEMIGTGLVIAALLLIGSRMKAIASSPVKASSLAASAAN